MASRLPIRLNFTRWSDRESHGRSLCFSGGGRRETSRSADSRGTVRKTSPCRCPAVRQAAAERELRVGAPADAKRGWPPPHWRGRPKLWSISKRSLIHGPERPRPTASPSAKGEHLPLQPMHACIGTIPDLLRTTRPSPMPAGTRRCSRRHGSARLLFGSATDQRRFGSDACLIERSGSLFDREQHDRNHRYSWYVPGIYAAGRQLTSLPALDGRSQASP